jgi:hypothetical protein
MSRFLYHGTAAANLPAIAAEGLKPRGKRKGNWTHSVDSCPDAIYLTNAYALHYAHSAAKPGADLAVLEIDAGLLAPWLLTPDEDWLEQTSRKSEGHAPLDRPMKYRTRWYRKRLMKYAAHHENSLAGLGNCAYHGPIPAMAITRVALVDAKTNLDLIMVAGLDPTISLINYRVCGPKYRNGVRRLFGYDDLEPDHLDRPHPAGPEHEAARAAALKEIWGKVKIVPLQPERAVA